MLTIYCNGIRTRDLKSTCLIAVVTGFEPVNWSSCLVNMVVYDNISTWVRSPSVLYVYFIPSKTFLVISQKRSSVSKLQLHVVLDHMCLWYKFGLDIFCLLRHSSGRKWFEYICKGVQTHIWWACPKEWIAELAERLLMTHYLAILAYFYDVLTIRLSDPMLRSHIVHSPLTALAAPISHCLDSDQVSSNLGAVVLRIPEASLHSRILLVSPSKGWPGYQTRLGIACNIDNGVVLWYL